MCGEQRQREELRTQYEQAALFQHPKNFESNAPFQRKCTETYKQKKTRAPARGRARREGRRNQCTQL